MKTSISLQSGMSMGLKSWADSARFVKQAGFDGIDLDMYWEPTDPFDEKQWRANVMAQVEAARAVGLELSQCHLPSALGHIDWPGNGTYEGFEEQFLPQYILSLELCQEIGCNMAVLHPYFSLDSTQASIEGNVKLFQKLMPTMERCGVSIAMENVYAMRDGHHLTCAASYASTLLEIIKRVDSPLLGVCIDTGHANINNIDIIDMAKEVGSHLIALHVNQNAKKDEHVLPYTMADWYAPMDFHGFSKALKEIGYQGTYNLEVVAGPSSPLAVPAYYQYAAAIARVLADEAE